MSFNSPVHCGMRRSPSAVFARAQRDIHRPAMTPEEAGDIAQVPTCLVVCVAHVGPSPCGVLPALSEHSAALPRLGGKGVDGMSLCMCTGTKKPALMIDAHPCWLIAGFSPT